MKFDIKNVKYDGNFSDIAIGDEVFYSDDLAGLEDYVKGNYHKGIYTGFKDGNFHINNDDVNPCRFIYSVKAANTGKSYAKRKKNYVESKQDFYATPKGLVYELLETDVLNNCQTILEPAVGAHAISNILIGAGFDVTEKDIVYGNDFLEDDYSGKHFDAIVTNPPFTLFDKFVNAAKKIDTNKIVFIGKTNFFGSHKRTTDGIWNSLSDVYIFDRQVAYDREFRPDGKMECGCLVTGWFVWTKDYTDSPKLHFIDVQKWIAKKEKKTDKGVCNE